MGARVVFCTFGSLGDVFPYLALARELKRRGHSPAIATLAAYRKLIEAEGIAFHAVRPDIDIADPAILRRVMDPRGGGRYVICDLLLPALRASYEDTAAAAGGASLLVTHPVSLGALLYARKTGMPWVSTALAPLSFYSALDPPALPGLPFAGGIASLGPAVQRRLLQALAFLFEPQWKPYRELEKELGLARSPNPLFWGHSPHIALGLFSPLLAAPQPDWPPPACATGFPFLDQGGANPAELERFLSAGEPPVVFTLGSAAVGAAGDFFAQSAAAAQLLGRRAVLLCGRDPRNRPPGSLPKWAIALPYSPHAALFPRGCAVVHQGGIGTSAEALRAGRPMLVVPFSHDQPDNAARLTRLGVARALRPGDYHAAAAARELDILLRNGEYANRAAALGERVGRENGTDAACDLLCRLISKTQRVCA